jgi:hypothetical protein
VRTAPPDRLPSHGQRRTSRTRPSTDRWIQWRPGPGTPAGHGARKGRVQPDCNGAGKDDRLCRVLRPRLVADVRELSCCLLQSGC